VGSWTVRTTWHTAQGRDSNGPELSYAGNVLLCAAVLAALLVIGGVELNPGPGLEAENRLQILCSGRWFHKSCGNVKVQMTDSGKRNCDRCRWDRLCQLEVELENVLQQTEELKRKNEGRRL
jgi:hypothetical protein